MGKASECLGCSHPLSLSYVTLGKSLTSLGFSCLNCKVKWLDSYILSVTLTEGTSSQREGGTLWRGWESGKGDDGHELDSGSWHSLQGGSGARELAPVPEFFRLSQHKDSWSLPSFSSGPRCVLVPPIWSSSQGMRRHWEDSGWSQSKAPGAQLKSAFSFRMHPFPRLLAGRSPIPSGIQ